jgi:exodeoxyribonuclease VII large subunit
MTQVLRLKLSEARELLTGLRLHTVFQTVAARVTERAQRVDDAVAEMNRLVAQRLSDSRHRLLETSAGVIRYDFERLIRLKGAALAERDVKLASEFSTYLNDRKSRLAQATAILGERSPLTILNRGYSITRDAAGKILHDAAQVAAGDDISIRLAHGELEATVRDKNG